MAGDQGLDLRGGVGELEAAVVLRGGALHVAAPLDQGVGAALGGRVREAGEDLEAARQRGQVERLAGEEGGEGAQGAGLGDGVGEYQALVRRALGRGEQALAERGDAQLAARVELDDAEDHRGLAVIQEVPVVDVEELEQRRRVVDAVADRGDELADVAQAVGLRHIEGAVQPIYPRRAGLADSGHVASFARARGL